MTRRHTHAPPPHRWLSSARSARIETRVTDRGKGLDTPAAPPRALDQRGQNGKRAAELDQRGQNTTRTHTPAASPPRQPSTRWPHPRWLSSARSARIETHVTRRGKGLDTPAAPPRALDQRGQNGKRAAELDQRGQNTTRTHTPAASPPRQPSTRWPHPRWLSSARSARIETHVTRRGKGLDTPAAPPRALDQREENGQRGEDGGAGAHGRGLRCGRVRSAGQTRVRSADQA
ncbi:hypothetical protein AOA12_17820 [Microbacterium sp. No. 7]|nr:hypothetical protein AOA12_17820 [Microbacterium sp. No. 7]